MAYQERIRPGGLNIHESLQGLLPNIDLLRQIFADQLSGIEPNNHRISQATHYTKEIRADRGLDLVTDIELADPEKDVISALFLDCIDYVAADTVLAKKSQHGWDRGDDRKGIYDYQTTAHARLRSDIAEYEQIYAGASDKLLYHGLSVLMYDAACLLSNNTDLPRGKKDISRSRVNGILAEHKVLKGLKNSGWEWVRYATPQEDTRSQWDIVLPLLELGQLGFLPIQVKSQAKFNVYMNGNGALHVEVPMYGDADYFNLFLHEIDTLNKNIKDVAATL